MSTIRVSAAIIALLVAAAGTARGQRWGGGGPGVSQPRGPVPHGRIVYRVPVTRWPFLHMEDRDDLQRRSGGGSWDGSRPVSGGSPPVPVGPNYGAFFGYVPPRGQVITSNAPAVQPMRTRDAYRARRSTP